MRMLSRVLIGLLLLPSCALGQVVYPYFSPGGALSGTGTSQNVNLAAGAPFIAGPLPATQLPALSGDCTTPGGSGVITCTKTNGVAFAASATTDTTNAANISSGTLLAGRLPALSGDCTTPGGSGVITCTKTNGVAFAPSATTDTTNAANISSGTLPAGRLPALSGDCTTPGGSGVITCTKTNGVAFAPSATTDTTNAANISSGALPAGRLPALTGDVTTTVGTVATAITANAVTNADLAQMAANTLKGNNTSGTANAADLTVAQVQALLVIAASANPSATVGLTAVNGSAATYLRSDAAPALSLAIAPNVANPWTASPWVWSNTEPRHLFTESDQGADLKTWDIDVNAGVFAIRTRTDADGAGVNVLTATRGTTTAITNISLGNATNNPTFTWLGTGTATFGGAATLTGGVTASNFSTAGRYLLTAGNAASGTGAYSRVTNLFDISANGTQAAEFSSTVGTLNGTTIDIPNVASSSAATTGTVCWTTGTGSLTIDTTTTCLLSTRRVKKDVHPLDAGLAEVMQLRPVSYELRHEYDPGHLGRQVGLISEEVGALDDRLISHEKGGAPLGVRYQQLTAVLVKAIQEQQRQIEQLQRKVDYDDNPHNSRQPH